ncbi:hypothetical protein BKA70DRAFT_1344202, partial [Coprinopsis sp. MPI-PUGE-AT-0042]
MVNQLELVEAVQERLPMIRASMPTRTLRPAAFVGGALEALLSLLRISGAPKKASGGCKRAGALRSLAIRWLGTRRKGLGIKNRRLFHSCRRQTSYRRSTQWSFSIPLSSCITTSMCMVPVHSSLNPYSAYLTILPTLSLSSTPSQNASSTSRAPSPTPLYPHPRIGTVQPTLYRARSTKLGSREL